MQSHLRLPAGGWATYYVFEKRGAGIPMHRHGPELQHDVLCTCGAVRISNRLWSLELKAGEGHSFEDPAVDHEIVALLDGSATLHEYLHGMPEGYDALPIAEWHSSLVFGPLTFPLKDNPHER